MRFDYDHRMHFNTLNLDFVLVRELQWTRLELMQTIINTHQHSMALYNMLEDIAAQSSDSEQDDSDDPDYNIDSESDIVDCQIIKHDG